MSDAVLTSTEKRGAWSGLSFGFLPWLGVLTGLALAWSTAIWTLWPEWVVNAQYEYGKVVPILMGYLLLCRWRSRPPRGSPIWLNWAIILACICGLLDGLAVFIHEANPEWRLLEWLATGAATVLTLVLLHRAGGTPWVWHFAFPLLFFWMAVPWPRPWEMKLMQFLMRTNASIAAEVVSWFGVQAIATGNVIRLAAGVIGVDEACSGIRSLNGSLMISVFLGEWFGLRVMRRLWLVVIAVLLALFTNLARAILLVGIANAKGLKVMEAWHDRVGFGILILCVAGIAGAAWALRGRGPQSVSRVASTQRLQSPNSALQAVATDLSVAALAFAAVLLCCAVGIRAWYGTAPTSGTSPAGWTMHFPTGALDYEQMPIKKTTQSLLRFDFGQSAQWQDREGRRWQGFYFRWDAGSNSYHDLVVHDPEVCLRGVGLTLDRHLGQMRGLPLPVQWYVFKDGEEKVYVFNCLAEDGDVTGNRGVDDGGLSWSNRWQAALQGRRSGTKRRLELAVWGLHNDNEANAVFQKFLDDCWQPLHETPTTASAAQP
jgi:exosortase